MGKLADELRKARLELEAKLAKKAMRDACKAGAKVVAARIKADAPVLSGKVKASVKVRAGKRRKGRISYRVVVTGGHEDSIIGFVEFGRHGQVPNPFIRRGFEATKDQAADEMIRVLGEGIEALTAKHQPPTSGTNHA